MLHQQYLHFLHDVQIGNVAMQSRSIAVHADVFADWLEDHKRLYTNTCNNYGVQDSNHHANDDA